MSTCGRCGEHNRLHFKYCAGCGAELSQASTGALGTVADSGVLGAPPLSLEVEPMDEVDEVGGLRRRPGCVTVVLLAVLTSALISAATTWAMARYRDQLPPPLQLEAQQPPAPPRVDVPALVGISLESASPMLQSRRLALTVEEERPDLEVAERHVVAQQPEPGTQVDEGSEVTVVVSTGKPLVQVPDLVGQPLAEATRLLTEAGLSVPAMAEQPPDAGEVALVVTSTDPPSGSEVEVGSEVTVVSGPPPLDGGVPRATRTAARRVAEGEGPGY